MIRKFFSLGTITLLAIAGCSAESPDVAQNPPPAASLPGSSTPTSMAEVTGRQDLGMYNPYMGTPTYQSATPPPGKSYGR